MKGVAVVSAKLDELHEVPGPNPNVMTAEEEASLEASIRRHGYRQLITVVEREGGGYWISDGVHRKAILLRLGYVEVDVQTKHGTLQTVREERLSLNKNRGHLDLAIAASELQALEDGGLSRDDMQALGWTPQELDVLLASASRQEPEQVLQEGLAAGPATESTTEAAKRYTLTFTFDSKDERDALRAILLAAGASVEDGLRQVLGRAT